MTIANMAKSERSSTDQVYVVGFVPSYQLPKGRPCALDPFLQSLISDVENIFINGMNSSEVLTGYLCLQKFKSGHTAVITI